MRDFSANIVASLSAGTLLGPVNGLRDGKIIRLAGWDDVSQKLALFKKSIESGV